MRGEMEEMVMVKGGGERQGKEREKGSLPESF